MDEYRTPDQDAATVEMDARIWETLDMAVSDIVSCLVAIRIGEPRDVVERWVDAVYDGIAGRLRDGQPYVNGMRRDERVRAIILLLHDRARTEADTIVRDVEGTR